MIQTCNSVTEDSFHSSTAWTILLWLSVVIVIFNFSVCSSDEEVKETTTKNETE